LGESGSYRSGGVIGVLDGFALKVVFSILFHDYLDFGYLRWLST